MRYTKGFFIFICLSFLLVCTAYATELDEQMPPTPESSASAPVEELPTELAPTMEPEQEPQPEVEPTPTPEPNIQINIEAEPPHYFWDTPFTDYTVTEGLLLLAFCFACLFIVFKIFK